MPAFPKKLTIDNIYDLTLAIGTTLYTKQVIKWIKEAKTIKSFDSHITLSPPDKSIRILTEKSLFLSYLFGYDEANIEIDRQEGKSKSELKAPSYISGYNEALLLFKKKGVISGAKFKEAEAYFKNISFSVQRIERFGMIKNMKESILSAIDTGRDFESWKENVNEVFRASGLTPLQNWHLKVIYRTNIMSAYNIAHRVSYANNAAVGHMMFDAVIDRRTSDICGSLDGAVYPKNDPIWGSITPPVHYLCRSRIRGLTPGYMKRKGIKQSPESMKKNKKNVHSHFTDSPKNAKNYAKEMENNALLKQKESDSIKIPKQH